MRYIDAVARLDAAPPVWPEPPAVLRPVRLDPGDIRPRGPLAGPRDAIASAVLVLVAPDREPLAEADAEVILIERVDRGGHHSGEISFPGGRTEGDEDAPATALREAAEEIGLDDGAAGVRIVALLDPFWIPVSNYRVHPIVAVAARRPRLSPSPDEVASIVHAPVAAFLPAAAIDVVDTEIRGMMLRFGAYSVAGHRVWGATARVLGQLGAVLG